MGRHPLTDGTIEPGEAAEGGDMTEGNKRRNVALVGPNGVGKTTLLESLLFVAGAIGRKGRVIDKSTVGDLSLIHI